MIDNDIGWHEMLSAEVAVRQATNQRKRPPRQSAGRPFLYLDAAIIKPSLGGPVNLVFDRAKRFFGLVEQHVLLPAHRLARGIANIAKLVLLEARGR